MKNIIRYIVGIALALTVSVAHAGSTSWVNPGSRLSLTNDGTKTTILPPTGDYLRVGDAGTTNHSLAANDDLFVSGKLEVDGASYFDNTIIVADGQRVDMGSSSDAVIQYNVNQTPDTLLIGTSTDSESLLICQKGDRTTDFGHAQQTNPTIFLHSADATDTTQWMSFAHDQTDGVIDVGTGKIKLNDQFEATSGSLSGSLSFTPGSAISMRYYSDDGFHIAAGNAVGTGNHAISIVSSDNVGKDHDHDTLLTNPTLYIHSVTDPDSDNTQWMSLAHDQTNGVIGLGKGDLKVNGSEGKGQSTNIRTKTESVTFAANPGDASKTTSGSIIPDGAFVVGVSTRVTTAATNCASVNIGDGVDADMFGAATGISAGTVTTNADATAQFGKSPATSAGEITVTGVGGNCFDGVWAITVHYIDVTGATSD